MNPWLYIISLVCTLFSGVGGQILIETIRRKRRASKRDIFISYPIQSMTDPNQSKEIQNIIYQAKEKMNRRYSKLSICFSDGKMWKDIEDFTALKESREYFLIYPDRLASSVLIELGCALGARKPSTIFVKDPDDLPEIIRKIWRNKNCNKNTSGRNKKEDIDIIIFKDYNNLDDLLLKHMHQYAQKRSLK